MPTEATQKYPTDCHYCSVVSQANGEDPIGSAGTADQWLVVEVSTPWSPNPWQDRPLLQPVLAVLKELEQSQQALKLRLMAIAPDKEYSQPGQIRVFYYSRPGTLFSQFEKQEYIVPETEIASLVRALLIQPQMLEPFQSHRQASDRIREILVCTHTQVDTACGRFGYPLYEKLRQDYTSACDGQLRIWQTSHFGGHKFAPTLIDFPAGRFWGHLQPEALDRLIHQNGSVAELRRFYRGWSGLEKFEQIAEREIWMQEGWDWINYNKTGRVIAKDEGGILKHFFKKALGSIPLKRLQYLLKRLNQDAAWVDVLLEYTSPDSSVKGAYRARVEISGEIMSKPNSGKKTPLRPVKQYRVSRLEKVK